MMQADRQQGVGSAGLSESPGPYDGGASATLQPHYIIALRSAAPPTSEAWSSAVSTEKGCISCPLGQGKVENRTPVHRQEVISSPTLLRHLQVEEGVLRLNLPALRRVGIRCNCLASGKLRLDRDSFRGAAGIEFLSLETSKPMTLLPDCFAGLTALATVELERSGLVSVPAALTALSGSLTSLSLSWIDNLQLNDDDVATLLTLRMLRHLDLRKLFFDDAIHYRVAAAAVEELRYEPALWTTRSLQRLVMLPKAFLAQHGHDLDMEVHQELDVYEESESEEEDDG